MMKDIGNHPNLVKLKHYFYSSGNEVEFLKTI